MAKTRIVDVNSLDEAVYWGLVSRAFDFERFEVVRAGKGTSEDDICELVRGTSIIKP